MKKALVICTPILFALLTGCVDMLRDLDSYDSGYTTPGTVPQTASGNSSGGSSGGKPHPYSVTSNDQAQFDQLNNEIQGRQQQLGGSKTATAKNSPQGSASSAPNVASSGASQSQPQPTQNTVPASGKMMMQAQNETDVSSDPTSGIE